MTQNQLLITELKVLTQHNKTSLNAWWVRVLIAYINHNAHSILSLHFKLSFSSIISSDTCFEIVVITMLETSWDQHSKQSTDKLRKMETGISKIETENFPISGFQIRGLRSSIFCWTVDFSASDQILNQTSDWRLVHKCISFTSIILSWQGTQIDKLHLSSSFHLISHLWATNRAPTRLCYCALPLTSQFTRSHLVRIHYLFIFYLSFSVLQVPRHNIQQKRSGLHGRKSALLRLLLLWTW